MRGRAVITHARRKCQERVFLSLKINCTYKKTYTSKT